MRRTSIGAAGALVVLVWVGSAPAGAATATAAPAAAKNSRPAVLILNGQPYKPPIAGDFRWFRELHERGFDIDTHFVGKEAITWDRMRRYNVLVFLNLPAGEDQPKGHRVWKGPPHRKAFMQLLDRYLAAGGGVFVLPYTYNTAAELDNYKAYLTRWGLRMPLERIRDPRTETRHPRSRATFVYANRITPGPVSEGVKGTWFPVSTGGYHWFAMGQPIDVSGDWQVVLRASDTSFTETIRPTVVMHQKEMYARAYLRPKQDTPPVLMAIRPVGGGRVAATALWAIFHLHGGTSWIHDRVVLDKGLGGKRSDWGRLFENTLRWLSAPGLASGKLGGYRQDPKQLVEVNRRKKPDEFYPQFDSYQNPTPPGHVYRGLVGARTAYSTGTGTVADYAAAARRAGLDFVVFLERFGKITQADYRKLEADCRRLSTDTLLLVPGWTMKNNIGNHMFTYGQNAVWPTPTQVTGPDKDQWRLQCFDKQGKLAHSDEDAKNWIWATIAHGKYRNLGYYNLADGAGVPVRNLRLFGVLAVMTYIKGKLVEDLTREYLDYVMDGDPPLACAVDLVHSPSELERAVRDGHYLTHVAGKRLEHLPRRMHYGHQYGRANVYPSNGPAIKSWAGTRRVMTYAGEPFVPARYRIRPLCWVTSDVGLKEIVIYCDRKPYRRLLLNGAKEFKRTFEWSYDRHRIFTLVATDVKGRRAVSAGFECWGDVHANTWCHDRQNGELWHGPFGFPGPRNPKFTAGPTWDGGPRAYIGAQYRVHPAIKIAPATKGARPPIEGLWWGSGGRLMEGNVYPTCYDDNVSNAAVECDHVYAPGVVANAYHTLGPRSPSKYMTFTLRRTQYLQRIVGPARMGWPMYAERAGSNVALFEGTVTVKRAARAQGNHLLMLNPYRYPKNDPNVPLWAVRMNNTSPVACGGMSSFTERYALWPGLGFKDRYRLPIDPGGYVAVFPSQQGNTCVVFNVGREPLWAALPRGRCHWTLPWANRQLRAGQTFAWRFLVVQDALDQPAHNTHRIERLRQYLGLDGGTGSGIEVKRGKLLSHVGLVDLAPQDGVVEFVVRRPKWLVDVPLGLRFIGFNPNWTVGQFQRVGYSPGFYTRGRNVYRNLATDDRAMVHLAVYPDGSPRTHSIVGHPVQCDAPELVIELAMLSSKPPSYHVAVNNPTDRPIKTTLRKCMDLPGFTFADRAIDVAPGAYVVVRAK